VVDITDRIILERQRADFLAMITHDFKTPISAIILSAGLMLKRPEVFGPKSVKIAETIKNSVERLRGMAEDFMICSKLESGASGANQFAVEDIGRLLSGVRETFSTLAHDKGLVLEFEVTPELPPVSLDRGKVERALFNLVQNAINYTPTGGRVSVKAAAKEGQAVISVSDTGPGIAPEEQAKVFERYYRSSATNKVQGTGLGLAVVKAVAEAHGGSVTLTCPPGQGCTFRFALPLQKSGKNA
jgi:signal transduction histidine kinase